MFAMEANSVKVPDQDSDAIGMGRELENALMTLSQAPVKLSNTIPILFVLMKTSKPRT